MARLPAKKAVSKEVQKPATSPAVSKEIKMTRAILNRPEVTASAAINSVLNTVNLQDAAGLDVIEAQRLLKQQAQVVKEGDLTAIEGVLVAQLQVLHQSFSVCMAKGFGCKNMENILAYTHLALKMQEQTRRTASTLASIKAPRQTAFIKQQVNTAQNQQVINGPVANHTSKNFLPELEQRQNELGGRLGGMDAGATIETIGIDTPAAAMGEVHRAEDSRGQTQIGAKLV